MGTMRAVLAAGLLAVLSGCLMRPGNPYNVGKYPHQWDLPGPETEEKVFGPVPFDEVEDFVRERESEGWRLIGFEKASLPEEVMVDSIELDRPARPERVPWTYGIPKTMDRRVDPPAPKKVVPRGEVHPTGELSDSIPPYVGEGVREHRQKYLVIMRRWL